MEKSIILGAGCFWCIETAYNEVKGVLKAESGYTDGSLPNPTYKEVCAGNSGHAEVVKITYDPAVVSLKTILDIFWTIHDPTTLNRQGNDVGTQYRSAIYYNDDTEYAVIQESIATTASQLWEAPLTTQISAATTFYMAEAYHQNYYKSNPNQGYCAYIITPKMAKFRKTFSEYLK